MWLNVFNVAFAFFIPSPHFAYLIKWHRLRYPTNHTSDQIDGFYVNFSVLSNQLKRGGKSAGGFLWIDFIQPFSFIRKTVSTTSSFPMEKLFATQNYFRIYFRIHLQDRKINEISLLECLQLFIVYNDTTFQRNASREV